MRIKILLPYLVSCIIITAPVIAQETADSSFVAADTILSSVDTIDTQKGLFYKYFKADYPNPKKAALLSLILPGTGQIYNKRWWKTPFVYGAFTGVILLIDYNNRNFKRLDTALDLKRDGEPHEFSGTSIDDLTSLRNIRDGFDKNRQLSYFALVGVYALTAVEAYVDAHLKDFDIDENISLRLKPSFDFQPQLGGPIVGLSFQFYPSSKDQHLPKFYFP